jgi:hypothetical protein
MEVRAQPQSMMRVLFTEFVKRLAHFLSEGYLLFLLKSFQKIVHVFMMMEMLKT